MPISVVPPSMFIARRARHVHVVRNDKGNDSLPFISVPIDLLLTTLCIPLLARTSDNNDDDFGRGQERVKYYLPLARSLWLAGRDRLGTMQAPTSIHGGEIKIFIGREYTASCCLYVYAVVRGRGCGAEACQG